MALDADELISAFRETEHAPMGKWWQEFPLGLSYEYGGTRRADFVVVTSHQPRPKIQNKSPDWFRERMKIDWLQGESVSIIEVKAKGDKDSWKALGQLQIYQKLFDIDWNANVEELIILADESVPGEDSKRLLKDHFEDIDLYVFDSGKFR